MMEAQSLYYKDLVRRELDQTPRFDKSGYKLQTFKFRIVGQRWANENGIVVYKGLYVRYCDD
jgi:hypothetical protein